MSPKRRKVGGWGGRGRWKVSLQKCLHVCYRCLPSSSSPSLSTAHEVSCVSRIFGKFYILNILEVMLRICPGSKAKRKFDGRQRAGSSLECLCPSQPASFSCHRRAWRGEVPHGFHVSSLLQFLLEINIHPSSCLEFLKVFQVGKKK